MKRLLLIVLPLLLIVGCSKPINDETLIEKGGLKYHPETKELYSGEVFQNRMGGEKEFEGSYKDGKKDGLWITWFENGLSNFKYFTYYRNGKKEQEQLYKDEKLSFTIGWYENGKIKSQGIPKDGKVDGDGLWTFWYENGQKKYEGTYKDGKRDGLETKWYENGTKSEEMTYKDGKKDGLWTEWNENGRKKIKGINKDGRRDGLWTWWYENGQKKEEVTFKDGEMISGKKWNKDGSVKE